MPLKPLIVLMAFGLLVSGCNQVGDHPTGKNDEISATAAESPEYDFPEGAVPPKGVMSIKKGMTRKELLDIMAPLYEYDPWAGVYDEGPAGYTFKYIDGGIEKIIEVEFMSYGVAFVAYGYTETRMTMY